MAPMGNLLWRWFTLALSVFVASHLRIGISYDTWTALLVVALSLSIVNAFVKPVLMLISLPLILLSFGIFVLIINALLFYAVGAMVNGFHVNNFWSALCGSIVVSLVSLMLGANRKILRMSRQTYPPRPPPPGKGPIIDV
jgi:putative membrane protein